MALAWMPGGCQKAPPQAAPPPPEVLVTEAVRRDVPVYRTWLGNLDGEVNTQVRAKVTGYLISQNYKEGSFVKEGDLLFQIDPRPLQAALEQAKGDLARAEASERLTCLNNKRASELFAGKVISAQERDASTTDYGTARADVKARRAAVVSAQLNLDYARITAPVDGIAGIATAQVGDLVGPESAQNGVLTTISSINPIKAYVTITEQDYIEFARRLAKGAAYKPFERNLELILADGSIYPQKGTFSFADRQVDPTTGSMRVAAAFPNAQHILRPGLFCRIRAQTAMLEGAVAVPERAISDYQGSPVVAVIGPGGKASIRVVQTGEREPPWRIIRKGIDAGETVVVEGIQKVRDGATVTTAPWKPAASP